MMTKERKTSSHLPPVTMALLTYNSAASVTQSLAALLAQDYPNLEILVQDDASSDKTVEICRRQAAGDPRVRIEPSAQNLGAWRNFALAAERAKGRFICWACPGDSWKPSYVSSLVERLLDVPGAVAAQSAVQKVDEETREPLELDQMHGPLAAENMAPFQCANAVLIKTHRGQKRPRYAYFNHGLLDADAIRKTLRAIGDLTSIIDERVVVCHLALAGPLLAVREPLLLKEHHRIPWRVRKPNDQTMVRRTDARFIVTRVGWFLGRSILANERLPLRRKLLMPPLVVGHMFRLRKHDLRIKIVAALQRRLPQRAYEALRRQYRLGGSKPVDR